MKALVLFSGGLDSTTLLALAVSKYGRDNVIALSIIYGQKHSKEIDASNKIAEFYGVEHIYLNLAQIFKYSDCVLLEKNEKDIPTGNYKAQLNTEGSVISTYVPFRNGLFLSSAASIAISKKCDVILYGAHDDDVIAAYPDCSKEFTKSINDAIYIGSGKLCKVEGPFVGLHKKDIVKIGTDLNVPYNLTWSCYSGNEKACGKCATCIDRLNAFKAWNLQDPIEYEED